MRRLFFLFLILTLILPLVHAEKAEDVKLNGFVNDYANVIDANSEMQINVMLQELYDNKTAQIAVVTIQSLEGRDIEGFAHEVAEGKLGDTEKDNGLLLLIAVEDRQWRFEVGRGLEPWLNDAKVGRIGRNALVPAFKQGDYSGGILKAVQDIKKEINNPSAEIIEESSVDWGFWVFFFLLIAIIFGIHLIAWISLARRVAKKNKAGKYEKVFMAGYLLSGMMRGRGGLGGVGGGGFGGFGGGSFGGGGASGGW